MQQIVDFLVSPVLYFLGRLLGWLRGGASSASSYMLHVLSQVPALLTGAAQLGLAVAAVGVFVFLSRFALQRRPVLRVRERARVYVVAAVKAYVMHKRRWLGLWKAFVRNRRRIKFTLLWLNLVKLLRVTYVLVEDIFWTCRWYFWVMQDYAWTLAEDFLIYYEEYFIESENLAFTYWYYFYIFREQVLYFEVARRVLRGASFRGRRRHQLRWAAALRRRRLDYLAYHDWVAYFAYL